MKGKWETHGLSEYFEQKSPRLLVILFYFVPFRFETFLWTINLTSNQNMASKLKWRPKEVSFCGKSRVLQHFLMFEIANRGVMDYTVHHVILLTDHGFY